MDLSFRKADTKEKIIESALVQGYDEVFDMEVKENAVDNGFSHFAITMRFSYELLFEKNCFGLGNDADLMIKFSFKTKTKAIWK